MSLLRALKSQKPLTKIELGGPLISDSNRDNLFAPSFVDLLPVKRYLGDGIFHFRNGGLGSIFKIETISLEATTEEYQEEVLDALTFVLKNAISYEHIDFWLSQMFIIKKQSAEDVLNQIHAHCNKNKDEKTNTKFAQNYLESMDSHIQSLSNKNGAFIDKETGEPWSLSQLEIYFCFWQEKSISIQDLNKEFDIINDAIVRIEHALVQAKIKPKRMNGQNYVDFISGFFHDKKIPYKQDVLNTLDEDLSQIALNHPSITVQENGIFCFKHDDKVKYATYMPLEKIDDTSRINVGHLSAENKNTKLSLFDRLPVGSIWSQTTIYISHDKADEYLEKIKNSSIGKDTKSSQNSDDAESAKVVAAQGDYIVRYAAGLFLFHDKENILKAETRKVNSIFGALGLNLLEPKENPLSQDDFIRSLPFCFNYALDRKFYKKCASLQHISTVAALSPFYGRSTGTGSAGVVKFNRGGEPLMFDPVIDKSQNAFGLLFGPSGTGKSAWLIEFLFSMMAIHNPKHVFIIEKGDSFGLFVDHCKQQGLSANKVTIKASSKDIHLPPFANATRLITDKGLEQERDLLGELLIIAQLMITGGETKESEKFERSDWDTVGNAIQLAAQNTLDNDRDITLTEDVINALNELADSDDLMDSEKERIRKMAKSMRVYINSEFDKQIFNTPGELFPESDITQLDVGVFGSDGYESKLVVAFASLVNDINRIAEQNQFSGRPIFLLIDEAHLFTKHPLIISWILKMVKMWRKWGVWVWFATPSLKDYTDAASSMFDTIEWIICLKIKKSEAAELAKLIDMTEEQRELIASIKGAKGQYKEGVVISDTLSTLFRSVSMPLALALAMTEQSEKAIRQKIMEKNDCSEMEAAYMIADEILQTRVSG
ncbi:Type IV secretory pathway, VirB4 components [hydrothermal vent metagenome]|uniref:Type IV secretory pathway, VirB4 components n=1 Tax=hydrothermal vent metagenome TaxID=652676 RepID=A0A1W1E5F5_9ZZZZ